MSRVVLMTSPEKGHVNPMVGVAQWLVDDGHHVGWLALPAPAPQIAGIGVEALRLPTATAEEASDGPIPTGEELARLLLDDEALGGMVRDVLLGGVEARIEPLRALVRSFRPDVMAVDPMLYEGFIVAATEGIPIVAVSSSLTWAKPPELSFPLVRHVEAFEAERASLFARFGVRAAFVVDEALSPLHNLVFATDALVGKGAVLPPMTELVGPSIPKRSRGDVAVEELATIDRLPEDAPIVYASFGSHLSWQPELFRIIAEAVAPLGARLVLSAGELAGTAHVAALPGEVLAMRYVPQLELLSKASVFIHHGGANSLMEGLHAGVPMLVIPMCNDQPIQAHYVAASGVGRALAPVEVTVTSCRDAVRALLADDGPARAAVRRVRDSYRAADGARTAARRIAIHARSEGR